MSTGFGMSSIALGAVRAFQREGYDVNYVKPIGDFDTPVDGVDRSVHFVRTMCGLTVPDPIPAARAEAMIRDGNLESLLEEVVGLVEAQRDKHAIVVVEGALPAHDHPLGVELNLAIPRSLNADVIAVVSGRGGTLRPVVEAIADAAHRYGGEAGRPLAGAIVARVPRDTELGDLSDEIQAGLKEFGLTTHLVGIIKDSSAHDAPRLIDFANDLGFKVFRYGNLDKARVKDVVVAARLPDKLVTYMKPGMLVVTPGDRSDLVLTAVMAHATGMPIAGLLLTCGEPMMPTISKFLTPHFSDLPILTTEMQTYEVAVKLSSVDRRVRAEDQERMERLMDYVADHFDISTLADSIAPATVGHMTPPMFRHRLMMAARQANRRIVLPEGEEPRTIRAAAICAEKGIARCVLLGEPSEVRKIAALQGIELPAHLEIIDPAEIRPHYIAPLVEYRKSKGMTPEQADKHLEDTIILGTMMVTEGHADGLVSGAIHTTAATVRPALQLIKTAPDSTIVSSVFFMLMPDQVLVYGDCAINPDPNASELAEIAIKSAQSARAFGIEPRVAMISYSTGASAAGEMVDKVREATRLVKERAPDLIVDGPIQYDAASVESVGQQKAPDSPLHGRANVFIFPDLNTGNTTYKAVQRSAGVVSVGPLLQGLRKPVNDLSRGASVDDIVYTIAMTAIQAA